MARHEKRPAGYDAALLAIVQDKKYLPEKAHEGDFGFDLRSTMDITLAPGQVTQVPLGVKLALPETVSAKIEGRSSLAMEGIFPVGGIIDSGYRGELMALLVNLTDQPFEVQDGDRVAQLCVFANYNVAIAPVDSFGDEEETQRGEGGFGSTGRG